LAGIPVFTNSSGVFHVRKVLMGLVVVTAALSFAPSLADAAACYARSPTGSYGWGTGNWSYARARALAECAARTPRGYYCRITNRR
jgi:hypothetical protein